MLLSLMIAAAVAAFMFRHSGWGYGDSGRAVALTGVPVLTNNWLTK